MHEVCWGKVCCYSAHVVDAKIKCTVVCLTMSSLGDVDCDVNPQVTTYRYSETNDSAINVWSSLERFG